MAVAYDAGSESHTGTTGSASAASFSWTHTPVGTPRGVFVSVFTNANADYITSVTYGGVTMIRSAEEIDTAGEPMRQTVFFLGDSLPTGAQTVVVNRTNNATVMYAIAATVTASADTTTVGWTSVTGDGTVAEVSVDDGSPGSNSVRFAVGSFGHDAVPTAGANSTLIHSIDFGSYTSAAVYETTAGQGARSVGMSSGTSDDRAISHFAITERSDPAANMKTFIYGRGYFLSNLFFRYSSLSGKSQAATSASNQFQIIPTNGHIGGLRLKLSAAPGADKSYIFYISVNGILRQPIVISGTNVTASSDEYFAVSAGDKISLASIGVNSPTANPTIFIQSTFISATSGESIILGGTADANAVGSSFSRDIALQGTFYGNETPDYKGVIPTPGTIKKLYFELSVAPGTDPDARSLTLKKNGSSTALTCSIVGSAKTANDTANTVSVSAGDDANFYLAAVDAPTGNSFVGFGAVFVPDTDGESIITACDRDDLSSSATEFSSFCGVPDSRSTTEATHHLYMDGVTMKKLYVELSGTPGAGKSYTFTARDSGSDTSLTCAVSGTGTTASDVSNTANFSGDYVSLKAAPSGTPTARRTYYGAVLTEFVPGPSASPSLSPSASPSQSPSASLSPSFSPSQSPSASISPSFSPSISPSQAPSASLSPSISPSISPSQSPSASLSPSRSPSLSPSQSPSASISPSQSPSASFSPSQSPSASLSPSTSPSLSPSQSPSASLSPSRSPSLSPSQSPSASFSPSKSPSLSPSQSPSASLSPSKSPSLSPSQSPSASFSPSQSPSASLSPSQSPSASLSPSDSPSASPSISPSAAPYGAVLRRWDGSQWVKAKLKTNTGSYVSKPLYVWENEWVEVDIYG